MIEKIKAFGESCKVVLLYIITPFAFLAGFIYYLFVQNESLKGKIERNEIQNKIEEEKKDAAIAVEKANSAESDYNKLREQYLKDHPGV